MAGAACEAIEARKTRMAAPANFSGSLERFFAMSPLIPAGAAWKNFKTRNQDGGPIRGSVLFGESALGALWGDPQA